MKILKELSACFGCTKPSNQRGAGNEASHETSSPAIVKLSSPYIETKPPSCLTPQKFKARQRTNSLSILRLDARVFDDTARSVQRICSPNNSYSSLVRALANVARLLEDELAVCNSEVEFEKVLLNRLKII